MYSHLLPTLFSIVFDLLLFYVKILNHLDPEEQEYFRRPEASDSQTHRRMFLSADSSASQQQASKLTKQDNFLLLGQPV